jgi:AdoMet-dependent rRNA methyltransferase SPB1
VLTNARVVIDLCAAPGGWSQVVAKTLPLDSTIIAVDLLPIKPIRNVRTLIADITSGECRSMLRRELQGAKADLVLCDGAPNVGAQFSKDAFVQNEISLSALRCATDHLKKGGTFVSKVYRSQDYTALVWVFKQLFEQVHAAKPPSSRSQSAEIFVVCAQYRAPDSIDPRLLDPHVVFRQLEDEQEKGVNVLHPQYGKQKRHRTGYDASANVTLTSTMTISDFIRSEDPAQALTDSTRLVFSPDCEMFLTNGATSPEIKACCEDLRVLGRADFKGLLRWRLKMVAYKEDLEAPPAAEDGDGADEGNDKSTGARTAPTLTEEEEEDAIQEEIEQLKMDASQKKRREVKKTRRLAAKLRERQALGMQGSAIELPVDDTIFSLNSIRNKADLEALHDVPSASHDDGSDAGDSGDSDDDDANSSHDVDADADDGMLERQLDESYAAFVSKRGDDARSAERNQRTAKRSKKAITLMAGEEAAEDAAMLDGDMQAYAQLLGPQTSADTDDDDSDDDEDDENPLVIDAPFAQESAATKAQRWFSNPLFDGMAVDDGGTSSSRHADDAPLTGAAAEVAAAMPLTDKQMRKEKRKREAERRERKQARQRPDQDDTLDIVSRPATTTRDTADGVEEVAPDARSLEKQQLIRAGIGMAASSVSASDVTNGFDVVPREAELEPEHDTRCYDSDNEDYDSDDRATTMAIASMMLRRSKAKELVDASYNR